jgi:hypothetical protein
LVAFVASRQIVIEPDACHVRICIENLGRCIISSPVRAPAAAAFASYVR